MNTYLASYTKINSKHIKDLNVRGKIIKRFEKNIGEKIHDIGFGNDFLNMTPKAEATKANTDKWYYIKLKTSSKDIINKVERQYMEWEKISANYILQGVNI